MLNEFRIHFLGKVLHFLITPSKRIFVLRFDTMWVANTVLKVSFAFDPKVIFVCGSKFRFAISTYVSFIIAILAKEPGFDCEVFANRKCAPYRYVFGSHRASYLKRFTNVTIDNNIASNLEVAIDKDTRSIENV